MYEKIYILTFLVLYFNVVFLVPSIRVKHKTGINPFVFRNTDSAQDYIGKVLTMFNIVIFVLVLANLFFPDTLQYCAPFTWLEITLLKLVGFILIHLALIWIIIAQVQMSNSWRVGIDLNTKTELKTKGLFSVSRNPVFLGMLITLLGIFLILPNAITMLTLFTTILLFQVQVRLEEEYLRRTQGDVYLTYFKSVRRWL